MQAENEVTENGVTKKTRTARRKTKVARRKHGEGSIWRTQDGRYHACVSQGTGKNRQRHTISGKSEREVIDEMARVKGHKLAGTYVAPHNQTVADFLREWLAGAAKAKICDATLQKYENDLTKHVLPWMLERNIKLQDLTVEQVEACLAAIEGDGARRNTHNTLSKALDHARRRKRIPVNLCADAIRTGKSETQFKTWTENQLKVFYEAIKGHRPYEAAFTLAAGTGARMSEILAAQWDDFDFDRARWKISRTLSGNGKRTTTKVPKTERGRRTIRLDKRSLDALAELRRENLKAGKAGVPWLWSQADGTHVIRSGLGRSFVRLMTRLERAGQPRIRFHDLRHTHATLLIERGASLKYVSARLGHADEAVTLQFYVHLTPEMETQAMEIWDGMFVDDADSREPAGDVLAAAKRAVKLINEGRGLDARHLLQAAIAAAATRTA